MSENRGLRVYVLGAGCSVDASHGYPLAKDFASELSAYSERIANLPECQQIKAAVDTTVSLLKRCESVACHASTIDQLISLILKGQLDDELHTLNGKSSSHIAGLQYRAVRRAKIATAACFLDKEAPARQRQIAKYREFIERHLLNETGQSTHTQQRLNESNARVLSFNYDRLFELAFFATTSDKLLSSNDAYSSGALNCGVNGFGEVGDIRTDRFCFLKLHGSIGFGCREPRAFGQEIYQLGDVRHWKEVKVVDKLWSSEQERPDIRTEPLIAFPFEKDFVLSGKENALSFRDYLTVVWDHATEVLREASEIWIIGYSFDPTDCESLVKRMRNAASCKRIVIQNIASECDRIADLLKIDYGFTIPVVKKATPF